MQAEKWEDFAAGLDGSLLVRNVPQQARRVLDAAGIGRLVTIR